MSSSVPSPSTVLEKIDRLAPPGTPLTTPEVADEFDCTDRTVYNRLDTLVDSGALETKKVGARGRVWWRPLREGVESDGGSEPEAAVTDSDDSDRERDRIREREEELAAELAATEQLQEISTRLIGKDDIDTLYDEILDAVVTVMDADFARLQLRDPDRGGLQLLADSGFDETTSLWDRVTLDSNGPCSLALETGQRVVVPDVETCAFMAGTEAHEMLLETGIRAVQSTPLVSRTGDVIGMLSTHWETSHEPSERDLRSIDVLARQAADIIRHRQAKDALRESEERYRELFESMTEGFCVIEEVDTAPGEPTDFRFVEANPAFVEHSGIGNVVGRTLRDVIPEEATEWIEIYDSVVQTGDAVKFERELVAEGRTLELYAFQVGDGTKRQAGVVFRDVTDRKRRIDAIREAHNRLQAATSAGSVGLWTWDVQEDTVTADEYVAESYGLAPEATTAGASIEAFFERVHEDDRDGLRAQIERALEETGELDAEYRVRNADDEVMWLTLRGEVEYDENDRALRMYGAISDITERKQREERERFLADLTEALQPISDPAEVQAEASRVLGEHLDVDRALYTEILAGEDTGIVHADYYSDDLSSVVGEHHFDDFGEHVSDAFRSGETQVVDDHTTVPGLSDEERATYLRMGIHAYVGVPLVKDGRLTALFAVTQTTPRGWTDDEVALIEETAERTWAAVERAYAEQALKRTNAGLERLTTASRDLMGASTRRITDRAAELTRTVLDVEYTALWRYDETTGEFHRHAHHAGPGTDPDAVRLPEGFSERVWRTFVDDERAVENDLSGAEAGNGVTHASGTSPLRGYLLIPLGRHGVVCAGSTRAETFDEQTIDLADTLAATLETAWNRAAGERQLARQNEELARLDRLNGLIREIDGALVEADSPGEIDRAVCDRLAASDHYAFAWIGERDPVAETITPREWAGVDGGYVDELTIPIDATTADRDPVAAAVHTRDLQVVSDIATETRFSPSREATLERGARSCISVPLIYNESLYGVLAVYADHPQPDERDHAVLEELGRTIGHAINAVETKETLRTDRVVELTLRCRGPTTPLCRLAREAGCDVRFEGLVHRSDGEPDVFFTASGAPSGELLAASERVSAITELLRLADRDDEALFRARVSEPTLASRIVEQDAVVRALTIEDGTATAVVDVPPTATVREFIDRLQYGAADPELLARRTRDRSLKTRSTFRAICEERLTAKQLAALETAYFSGFFESPRTRTGQEVAASLDVSQPTFTAHLRAAQRGICNLLFATEGTTADA